MDRPKCPAGFLRVSVAVVGSVSWSMLIALTAGEGRWGAGRLNVFLVGLVVFIYGGWVHGPALVQGILRGLDTFNKPGGPKSA